VPELIYQSPWDALAPLGRGEGVVVAAVERRVIAVVMARKGLGDALAAQVRDQWSIELNDRPKRAAANGVTFLGIGPGKWLAISQRRELAAELGASLDGVASVVEQSDATAMLRLSGPAVFATLEKGFQIDLAQFAVDDVAVTGVHHLGVTIWRTDDGAFEIAVARSLADAFLHWLGASAAAAGLAVSPGA